MKSLRVKFVPCGAGFSLQSNAAPVGPIRRGVTTLDVVNIPDEERTAVTLNVLNQTVFIPTGDTWGEAGYQIDRSKCGLGRIYR